MPLQITIPLLSLIFGVLVALGAVLILPHTTFTGLLLLATITTALAFAFWKILDHLFMTRITKLAKAASDPGSRGPETEPTGSEDIAQLSKVFAQLAETSQRELVDVKAALDAHSIVAITNPAGKITYVNDKFCEISKYSRDELLGQDHRIINSGYHPKSFFRSLWQTISKGKVWKGEIRNRAKDGSYYWVDTTIFPFLDTNGQPRQYVAIRTDITQRKQDELRLIQLADELAAKNKELETIVYVVSHDLRSPLLNVQGFGAALSRACEEIRTEIEVSSNPALDRVVNTDIPRALRFIEASVSKMDALLSGFLRFSRMGRVVLNIEPLEMNKIVSGVVQASKFQIENAGAKVNVGSLPRSLGDATLIGQVFSNLLDNALKYRHPDRPCTISIQGYCENGRSIYLVHDNGIGIAPEFQSKVFELFHRLNPKATEGDGLGLTITQRILERQQGRVWIESEPDKGTTFFISLPALSEEKKFANNESSNE